MEAEICAKHQALDELRAIRARYDEKEKELFEANRKIKQQKDELERSANENSFLRQQLAIKQQRAMLLELPESSFFNSFASPVSSIDTNVYQRNNSDFYKLFFRRFSL